MRALKTARDWGARPVQFLQEWSERDRGLALALHEYELTTGQSGYALAEELDSENDGRFRARPRINFAQRAIELAQKKMTEPEPGTFFTVELERKAEVDDGE